MAIKYRVVVVGLGSIGLRHARLLQERNDVTLEICEPQTENVEAAKKVLGEATCYASLDDALASKPDVVWLATPTPFHAEQSIKALEAGVHVFCEKPMTATTEESINVLQTVQKTGLAYTVGFPLHFSKGMQLLKELISSNKLGNILHFYARVGTYITVVNTLSRYQAHHPGSLFFDYAHQIDLMYWLLDKKPTTVYAAGFQGGEMEFSSVPNVSDLLFEYNEKLQAHIHLNYVQMPQRHTYELFGDEGWAVLDYDTNTLEIGNKTNQSKETILFSQERDDMFRAEQQAFFDVLAGLRAPETSASDGLVSTIICDATLQSWKENRKIEISF